MAHHTSSIAREFSIVNSQFSIAWDCPIMILFVPLAIIFFTLYIVSTMEPHPIPQNVTTFQFHLVGDMTLKQFLYLAAGSGIAYGIFVFFSHDYPIVAWPLIILSAGLGAAFAFLPFNSRPLDYWVAAFFKAIYSPTKRAWQKNGKTYAQEPTFSSRLIAYLSGVQPAQQVPAPPVTPPPPATVSTQPSVVQPLPTPEQLQKTVDLARQAQDLKMKIVQTERTLNQVKTNAQNPTQIPVDYTKQVNKTLADLQNLMTQASSVKEQIQSVSQPENKLIPTPIVAKPRVKVVVPIKPKLTQVALTSFPNVINGIIKDVSGNLLDGVVVVIYDKEGLPVRALKTNKLGQFTGSTPLHNGTYTVELEKDGFAFDVLQIDLTGAILPPLLITAKQAISS